MLGVVLLQLCLVYDELGLDFVILFEGINPELCLLVKLLLSIFLVLKELSLEVFEILNPLIMVDLDLTELVLDCLETT
jgi:hypothetical protein